MAQTTGKQSSHCPTRMYPTHTTAMWASLMMTRKSFLRTILSNWRSHQKLLQIVFSRGHLALQQLKLLMLVSLNALIMNATITLQSKFISCLCHSYVDPVLALTLPLWCIYAWTTIKCCTHNLMCVCVSLWIFSSSDYHISLHGDRRKAFQCCHNLGCSKRLQWG